MNDIKFPDTAILELTYNCNHQCKFCSCPWYNTENPALFFEKREELTLDDWKRGLHILESNGIERVGVSGGEPLLKDSLEDLLRYIRENTGLNKGKKITLISNGAAMSEHFLSVFKETEVHVSFSMPGLTTFSYHTGSETNSAANVLHWIKRAKEETVTTTVGITVTKKNIHELYETIANALIAGADTLMLNRFLVGGRGVKYKEELSLSKDDIFAMTETAETVLEMSGRSGSVGTEIPLCLINKSKREFKHLKVGSLCAAAKGFFVIDPSGYVRACNHSPKRLGYIFDDDIISDKAYWKMFADRTYGLPKMCSGCEYISKCDCGCREAASICYGEVSAPDPCMI